MTNTLAAIRNTLKLSVLKRTGNPRSGSIAYSKNGRVYNAGKIESDTHLLDISSEQASLVLATLNNDFLIEKIITITEEPDSTAKISPIVIKIIIDHAVRTNTPIAYTVVNQEGRVLYETADVQKELPFYEAQFIPLEKTKYRQVASNKKKLKNTGAPIESLLKNYALLGVERNFTTKNVASGYGAAVLTKGNLIYFGGQYSSFDKRTGLHAEMTTILSAIMDDSTDISHIGLISEKYRNTPCPMCGCCRQFVSELSQKYNINPSIYSFAINNNNFKKSTIKELLPDSWSSKFSITEQ